MAKKQSEAKPTAEQAASYTKQQFLASKQFSTMQKDMINALLKDGEKYTTGQVEQMIEQFLKTEVL